MTPVEQLEELRTLDDVLEDADLPLHVEVAALCRELEAQGWGVLLRRGKRLRYWCRCRRQHQFWVDLVPQSVMYVTSVRETLDQKTCFKND